MFNRSGKESSDKGRQGGIVSVIGADVIITGDIATADELRVDGRIDGDVSCGTLDQGPGGAIAGSITADEARVAGLVQGGVTVKSLVLEASARVTGDVVYETLSIAGGARVDGRLSHRAPVARAADGQAEGQAETKPEAETASVAELFPQAAE